MILSQFKVATGYTAPRRWFWVRIYDSVDSLRAVANRWAVWSNGSGGEYDDCVGCVQEVVPMIPAWYAEDDQDCLPSMGLEWPADGFAGVIRLSYEWLTTEIIAHEVTHAAVTVFRMNVRMRPELEGMLDPERPNEEALAYAVGELTADLLGQLHSLGYEKLDPGM